VSPAEPIRIEVPGAGSVSALRSGPPAAEWTVAYAPGAGSNLLDPFGAYLAKALEAEGVACLRFQFPYREQKRSIPDRAPVLAATWKAVLDHLRPNAGRIAATGRSMGGRMASMAVAGGEQVEALALFAYPLHPPGKPELTRTEHLPHIAVPTLFCSGDRDTFGTVEELSAAATLVPGARVHVLEGADHGFSVLKASGRRREDVWDEAIAAFLEFLKAAH
jgi:predicted alpha/beta-hydrolase family hydrolase